jgi:predicted permease
MPTAIIPILLTVAIGFALESYRRMEVRAVSTIVIYVLLPCLIFTSLLTTRLTLSEALPLMGVVVGLTLSLWVVGKVVARAGRYDAGRESYLLITTIFMNAGNMGMPVALYAFGNDGLDLAVIWVLVVNTLSNTIAVYYVSRHLGGARQAMRTVFTLPTLYAAVVALGMRNLHLALPGYLLDPLQLLGKSVIPVSQLLLGIQLAKSRAQVGEHLREVIFPNTVRLLLSPAIALALAVLLGLHGLAFKVALLLAAMPTGINMAVYAVEFDARPRLVATAVFTSTVVSFFTITALLVMLR